jgi:hypothetical protein
MKPLECMTLLLENKYRLHVGMVSTTINDINLPASVPTTEVIRFMLEAEWLHNSYDKCNAQILQRKRCVSNIYFL